MKNLKLIILFTLGIATFQTGYSQDAKPKVYLIRSTGFEGSASAFSVFIDKQLTCKLRNKKFSIQELEPGEHRFTVQFLGKTEYKKTEQPLNLTLESGKTYYVQLVYQSGVLAGKVFCQEITESSAQSVLAACEAVAKCL